jgi:hypothetical protein
MTASFLQLLKGPSRPLFLAGIACGKQCVTRAMGNIHAQVIECTLNVANRIPIYRWGKEKE